MKTLVHGTRQVSRMVALNTDRLMVPLLIVAALSISGMALSHLAPY